MKKIYAFVAAVAAASTLASAQTVVTSDYDVVLPWDISDEVNPAGLTIIGATATVKDFALNVAGFPKSYATSGVWQPVTLSNGAAVKFFDEPAFAYPSAENWEESEVAIDNEWDWDDCALYASTSINNDWVIEGTGNEIYLDSYCEFNGTITGSGELTLYVSNNSVINMQCGNTHNEVTPAFQGVIYVKSLDGYTCDTINVGTNFKVGQLGSGAMNNKTYAGSCTKVDLTSFGGNIVWKQTGANSLVYPAIVGAGEIMTGNYPYFNGIVDAEGNPVCHEYDAKITLAGSTTHDFEVYGNDLAFNAPITGAQRFFYVRSSAAIYFNSKEPSCSEFTNDVSQRGTGFTGGTGYADISYWPNSGRVNTLSAGYPYWTVGQMTWKSANPQNGNVVRFDFDEEGHSDILNVANLYTMFSGENQVAVSIVGDGFAPKAGNYKVINGAIDAGMSTYVDTVGYEVWDNNGSTYCIRSVKGGEVIVDAVTGEEKVAAPGDSIGAASFGNLASKFGATIMDGNRPHYVIANWGPGSYSNGQPTDGSYKNTEDPALYAASPEQMGTAFSDPDSTRWEAVWQQFLAEHPCSDPRVAVGTDDPSVIPGTVTDSIFVTYSLRLNEEGSWVGHSWSWKNGNGYESSVKGYPYACAITYAYYYYSNNKVRHNNYVKSFVAATGDSCTVSFPTQTYPIDVTVYDNADSTEFHVVKRWYTVWQGVPQADGTTINYRFNYKNYISDGIIAIETQVIDATGAVVSEDLFEDKTDEIINNDDLDDINTVLKDTHAVKTRAIYTLDGKRVNTYQNGINVVTVEYTDGTVETKKVVF